MVVDNDSIPHRTPSQDGREEDDLHATIESQFTGWGFEEAMRRIAETNESHVAAAPRLGSLHKPLLEGHGTSVGQRVILRAGTVSSVKRKEDPSGTYQQEVSPGLRRRGVTS